MYDLCIYIYIYLRLNFNMPSFGQALIDLHTNNLSCPHGAIDKSDEQINELLEARIASLTQQLEDEKGVLDKIGELFGDLFGCAASRRPSACSRELQKHIKILEDRQRAHDENMKYISNELQALLDAKNGPKGGANPCTKKYNKSNKRICRTQIRTRTRTTGRTRTRTTGRTTGRTRTRTTGRTRTRTTGRTRALIRFG